MIDFGAVCQAANTIKSQTLIGSPGYAPPEQSIGQPVPQSDLYAAGATILRLLTGLHPSQLFNSKTERMEWESHAQISEGFAAILNQLTQRNLDKRISSAKELKERLKAIADEPVKLTATPINDEASSELATDIQQICHTESFPSNTGFITVLGDSSAMMDSRQFNNSQEIGEEGQLEQMPMLYLLRRCYRDRFSGALVLNNNSVSKSIYFEQGAVIFANSSLKSERLGEALMRLGRISFAEYEQAIKLIRSRPLRIGAALIEMGCITPEELRPLIINQVSNIIYSLFNWTTGTYKVRRDPPQQEAIKISVSTADLIFEGLRRLDNIELVKSWLGSFARKLTTTTDPFLLYQVVNLQPKEAFIVSRIDGVVSVDEILSLGGLPEAETLKTICGLLAVGILEWVDEKRKSDRINIAVANVLSVPQMLPANFDIQTAAEFCYEVDNMLRGFENATHYAVLGLERGATDEEIRENYARLAKRFHPDRHMQLVNYNLRLGAELEKLFSRISEAYRVLSNHRSRGAYDRSLRGGMRSPTALSERLRISCGYKKPGKPDETDMANKTAEHIQIVIASEPGAAVFEPTIEHSELAASEPAVFEPAASEKEASEPAVSESATPESAAAAPAVSAPAASIITQPLGSKKASEGETIITAQNWFQKGLEFYNAFQYDHASRAFWAAAMAAPNEAEYRIYLARCLAMLKGCANEAEQEFLKAIELEAKNAEYYAQFGLFYQKINLFDKAEKMFAKALEIDPNQSLALRAKGDDLTIKNG